MKINDHFVDDSDMVILISYCNVGSVMFYDDKTENKSKQFVT